MTKSSPKTLLIDPITRDAFADFGEVLGGGSSQTGVSINAGTTTKFVAAELAVTSQGGEPGLFIYRTIGQSLPLSLTLLEFHQFGSQTFVPLADLSFVVVVAKNHPGADPAPDLSSLRAFWVDGHQGISLFAGTWHHPLISLHDGELVVLERVAQAQDCLIHPLPSPVSLQARAL